MAEPDAKEVLERLRDTADAIADARDADVLLYVGPISRDYDEKFIEDCAKRDRRKNVFLMLTTSGGNADAAYRIARALQQHYTKFTAFVPGYCKSAGTLLVLGAHELVLSSHAELGPLDVQVLRTDELGERSSGLTPMDALTFLEGRTTIAFRDTFQTLRFKLQMTTRLAAEMSAALVSGLYQDVFSQIDPMRLGEMERAVRIAAEYGRRLTAVSKNAKEHTLPQLVRGYPSHAFVIDGTEARELFVTVSEPTQNEITLGIRHPFDEDKATTLFLNRTTKERAERERVKNDALQATASKGSGTGGAAGARDAGGVGDGAAEPPRERNTISAEPRAKAQSERRKRRSDSGGGNGSTPRPAS